MHVVFDCSSVVCFVGGSIWAFCNGEIVSSAENPQIRGKTDSGYDFLRIQYRPTSVIQYWAAFPVVRVCIRTIAIQLLHEVPHLFSYYVIILGQVGTCKCRCKHFSFYGMNLSIDDVDSDWSFGLPLLLQIVPAIGLGTCIHFFPYSPRWLAMRDRNQECLESLSKLRRLPTNDTRVQLEQRQILLEIRLQRELEAREYPNAGALSREFRA